MEIKFKPCKICIPSLREKLFEKKTKFGMIPFKKSKKIIKQFFYDMYTGYMPNDINRLGSYNFNIEHTVPASIIAPDPQSKDEIFIDTEPYHDLNILFPTITDVNSLRENCEYGEFTGSTEFGKLLDTPRSKKKLAIINKNEFYGNFNPPANRKDSPLLKRISDPSNFISDNNNYLQFERSLGKCVFQPAKTFQGDISRIVFYTYLMYVFDPTTRPFTKDEPWLGSVRNGECKGFDFDKFEKFFFDHLSEYYHWAKNDPISPNEIKKNKKIIKLSQVPNIFIGFMNKSKCTKKSIDQCTLDDYYVTSSFEMIEDLLFGKEHDHKNYTTIEFPEYSKIKPKLTKLTYSSNLLNIMTKEAKKDSENTGSNVPIERSNCAYNIISDNIAGACDNIVSDNIGNCGEQRKNIVVDKFALPSTSLSAKPSVSPSVQSATPSSAKSLDPLSIEPSVLSSAKSLVPSSAVASPQQSTKPSTQQLSPSNVPQTVSSAITKIESIHTGGLIQATDPIDYYYKYCKYKNKYLSIKSQKI